MRRALTVKILRLGLPILVGQLGMIVTGFADTTMVGHYSTRALAAASFVNNVFNAAVFACVGFTYGLTPLVGALFSQRRHDEVGAMLRTAVMLNGLFALAVTAIMGVVYMCLPRLGQPEELLPLIRPYFLLYLAGLIPISLFNVFAQWAYAINRTRMPMWIILCSNAVNIVGNYMLIYGNCGCPELGLTGAGIATFLARVMLPLTIMAVFFLRHDYSSYRRGFATARADRNRWKRLQLTSWPVALQMTFESGSFTMAAVMAGWISALALAAYQVVVIMGTLGFCVYYSIGAAISVLVANAAGAGNRELQRETAIVGYRIMLVFMTIASLTFIFAGRLLLSFFTSDAAVIALGISVTVPLVLYQLGDATQITFANALRGTGNVMPMLWISFVSYIVVGIPATGLLAFTARLQLYGIVLSFSVSLFLAAALFLYCFIHTTRPR